MVLGSFFLLDLLLLFFSQGPGELNEALRGQSCNELFSRHHFDSQTGCYHASHEEVCGAFDWVVSIKNAIDLGNTPNIRVSRLGSRSTQVEVLGIALSLELRQISRWDFLDLSFAPGSFQHLDEGL